MMFCDCHSLPGFRGRLYSKSRFLPFQISATHLNLHDSFAVLPRDKSSLIYDIMNFGYASETVIPVVCIKTLFQLYFLYLYNRATRDNKMTVFRNLATLVQSRYISSFYRHV